MPTESDIAKAYVNYYTHRLDKSEPASFVKKSLTALYQLCFRLTPLYAEQRRLERFCLHDTVPGRVLEVGCGNGDRLAQLRVLGWQIQGQEVDSKAAAHAREVFKVPVFLGPLDRAGFRDEEFDAVVMSHVLEHVHDPVRLLAECKRILRKDGLFVSITPNAKGWGHSRFGACWRGLEPPRHLFLFSRHTLERVAQKSGFRDVKAWTTAAHSLVTLAGSLRIQSGGVAPKGIWPVITTGVRLAGLQAAAVMARILDADAGDECVLSARK